ncbi:unnamed protein product [Peniophora sp. CBMAI 1063]|nr:unnamed protein product [Peniophora sp. CBMAI 1063]
MPVMPPERDSVYAVVLCYGQGDAARQAMRSDPWLTIGPTHGHTAMPSPPRPRHLVLPDPSPRIEPNTATPPFTYAGIGHDLDEDPPTIGVGPVDQQLAFTPAVAPPAVPFPQSGNLPVPDVSGEQDQPGSDGEDGAEVDDVDDDLSSLGLGAGEEVVDPETLPAALLVIHEAIYLIRQNELTNHPSRTPLVRALHDALAEYMPQHGMPAHAQPLVAAAAQEEAPGYGPAANDDDPQDMDGEAHADHQDDQHVGHEMNDNEAGHPNAQPAPDAEHGALPPFVPAIAAPRVSVAVGGVENVVLGPHLAHEAGPNADATPLPVGGPSDSSSAGPSRVRSPDPSAVPLAEEIGRVLQTEPGAAAFAWICERFCLQGQERKVDNALIRAMDRLKRLERQGPQAYLSPSELDPAPIPGPSRSTHAKTTRSHKLLRTFIDTVKWKTTGRSRDSDPLRSTPATVKH